MTRKIALHCIKSASELERELCEECPIYGQTGCDHCFEDVLQYVIRMLEQEPKWIPVTKRLPEENGGYLVVAKRGYVTTALWVGNAEKWKEITAWMPLPEPYKGGE